MTGFHALSRTVGPAACALLFGLRSPALSANHRAGAEAISFTALCFYRLGCDLGDDLSNLDDCASWEHRRRIRRFNTRKCLVRCRLCVARLRAAEGLGLLVALGALGLGIILWATFAIPQEQVVDVRDDYPSSRDERSAKRSCTPARSRRARPAWVLATFLLAASSGALGVAVLFPLRSLGTAIHEGLYRTKWTPGARLVGSDVPVRASDPAVGSILTVFPDGHVDDASLQTLPLRLPPGVLRAAAAPGLVATGIRCILEDLHPRWMPCRTVSILDLPVALSMPSIRVRRRAAAPISGPAARALPQPRQRPPTTDICARGATTRSRSLGVLAALMIRRLALALDDRLGTAHFVRRHSARPSPTTGRSCSMRSRSTALWSSSQRDLPGLFFTASVAIALVYNGSYASLHGMPMSAAYASVLRLSLDTAPVCSFDRSITGQERLWPRLRCICAGYFLREPSEDRAS